MPAESFDLLRRDRRSLSGEVGGTQANLFGGLVPQRPRRPQTVLQCPSAAEKIKSAYVSRVLRLTLLAPDIVEAILEGQRPKMTLPMTINGGCRLRGTSKAPSIYLPGSAAGPL